MIQEFNNKIPFPRRRTIYSSVYLIVCRKTNDVYVGSSKDIYRRMGLHRTGLRSGNHENRNLQVLYNTYGEDSFYFKYKYTDYTKQERLLFEEKFISLFKTVNIAKEPTKGGSPNKGTKLTENWKTNLHKNKVYKHNEDTLNRVTANNKKGACIILFYKENEKLEFNSWLEAAEHFGVKGVHYFRGTLTTYRGWTVEILKSQKKRVVLDYNNEILEFNSASACDKFLNMWRGATSYYLLRDGEICGFKVSYLESF